MEHIADHPNISTLLGTPKQVRAKLDQSPARRVLALTFDSIKPAAFEELVKDVARFASLRFEASGAALRLHRDRDELMERLAEQLVAPTLPSSQLFKEAAMLGQARQAVLASGDWLTAIQIAKLAGLSTRNPSSQPNKWKKQGKIFAIRHKGTDYFPGYGLDPKASYRPIKALAEVIKIFSEHKDSWGMAYWFQSDNSLLAGKRPQDFLATEPERVLEAAQDEAQEIAHA